MPGTDSSARQGAGRAGDGRGYGKLAGGFLGLVLGTLAFGWQGGVAGLIVGLFAGHWLDLRIGDSADWDPLPVPTAAYEVDDEAQRLFALEVAQAFAALVVAAERTGNEGAAASALGRFLRDQLGFPKRSLGDAAEALRRSLSSPASIAEACARCARVLPPPEQRLLVAALYGLAHELGLAAGPARMLLRDGVEALGLAEADEAALRAQIYEGDPQSHDYDLLGIPPASSDAEVRRAFRQLAGELHPDKVAHLGQKAAELATAQFQEVRGAYERIRLARGF